MNSIIYDLRKNKLCDLNSDAENIIIISPFIKSEKLCFCPSSIKGIYEDSISSLKVDSERAPQFLEEKIALGKVTVLNANSPFFKEDISKNSLCSKWKINVAGLGDVGSTLITGLRLLGGDKISSIGIFDLDENKMERMYFEGNQILDFDKNMPSIEKINYDDLFDCNMFIFCVSKFIPPIGTDGDVRIVQYKENAAIIKNYAQAARNSGFKGIFAVMSDPVDLLCKTVYEESNKDANGTFDYKGLRPENIKGYGLGVMNARAAFFSKKYDLYETYMKEGRAFGPHGEGLIIANSIKNYDEDISNKLTEETINANHKVRHTGFKPYIAPALSSGAISIIKTLEGRWHYSSVYIDGVFFGTKNRCIEGGNQVEALDLPETLFNKIKNTHCNLDSLYKKLNGKE